MTMSARSVIAAIGMGELDNELRTIIDAARSRENIAAKNRSALLVPGDRVRLTGLSPKSLNGLKGRITGRRGQRIQVEVDKEFAPHAGRVGPQIAAGIPLAVPAACVVPE